MNRAIWKFKLETTDTQSIEMPIGAKILTVQIQNQIPYLLALVDPVAEKEMRCIEVFGTGNRMACKEGERKKYIGTYQLNEGAFVFHVFEVD